MVEKEAANVGGSERGGALPPCPFCDGDQVETMSLFGSHASLTTCWCRECRSPFEFLRWTEPSQAEAGKRRTEGDGRPRQSDSSDS